MAAKIDAINLSKKTQGVAIISKNNGATWTVATPREPDAQEKLDAAERSEVIFTHE